jgi:hypothetical protein
MKYPYLILLLLLTVSACKKKEEQEIHSVYEAYYFTNNKQIEMTPYAGSNSLRYNVVSGNKTVFQYSAQTSNSGVRHYAHTGYLRFQADSGATSFSYTDSVLAEHLTYYYSMAGSPRNWGTYVGKGTIQGEKLANSTWRVYIDVTLYSPDTYLNISGIKENEVFTETDELK